MARYDRESTDLNRTPSMRLSMAQDDNEDYALAAMGISDGFRPSAAATSHNRISSHTSQLTPQGRRTPPPRPSSTMKPKGFDSFALRHDGAMGPALLRNSTGASNSNATPTRTSSVSTSSEAFVRPESPYQGPAGPSHPYQMYPQESRLARTASVATTSTMQQPESIYRGPGAASHPYQSYPQNTVPEGEVYEPAVPPVPIGFPGLNNEYHRRLGPEGEEIADIIGPGGHTEQLPPYSRFPDEAFGRKTRPDVQIPLAGAGGIGLATRNPEFESEENLSSPQSRQDTRSISSDSDHHVNMAAVEASEKPELKQWQKFARRKVCGIVPVWAIVLVGIVFILFGIILGAVLAALRPKHAPAKVHHPSTGDGQAQSESVIYTTMTTTFDASPLTALPTGLPTLPTGTYALPISAPSAVQNSCLVNTAQSSAWSCTVPMTSYLITINEIEGATSNLDNNEINLTQGNDTFGGYYPYGSQPPVLTQTEVLNLVTDSQDPTRGPAWFFEIPYNKVVIVEEDQLPALPGTKRGVFERDPQQSHSASDFTTNKKNVAMPGDKPWFCYWNGTLLEAFIYVNLTSAAGTQASAVSSTSSPTETSQPGDSDNKAQSSTTTYGSSMPTNFVQSSSSSSSGPSLPPGPLAYPKVLKLEERRIPMADQSVPPYCVQHEIDVNGIAQPFLNATGGLITIYLNETEPTSVSQIPGKRDSDASVQERDRELSERQSTGSCGCVWLWT